MHSIREAVELIRSIAGKWLRENGPDGATCMNEVTATLLSTSFEERAFITIDPALSESQIQDLVSDFEKAKSGAAPGDMTVTQRQLDSVVSDLISDGWTPPIGRPGAAMRDVAAERRRQVEVEGRTPELDDAHIGSTLARAAATYAVPYVFSDTSKLKFGVHTVWPWSDSWWKPTTYRQNLVKAGALILAEIERLDRAEEKSKPANWGRTKPEWSSHDWPQIFQSSDGNWFGVRAGWDLKAHISGGWKGDEVSLLSDDGKFIKYGEPSPDWRDSLEQRPVAELYTAADEGRLDRAANNTSGLGTFQGAFDPLSPSTIAAITENWAASDEARMDVVGQNGNDGLHYEALPLGLRWEDAPDWAVALIEADASNTEVKERVLVWVRELNAATEGVLAIDFVDRKAGNRQTATLNHPESAWTVVATRPVAAVDTAFEWTGGECPVAHSNTMVWVRLECDALTEPWRPGYASRWDWSHEPALGLTRIVAYRLTDPSRDPKPL